MIRLECAREQKKSAWVYAPYYLIVAKMIELYS